MLGYSNMPKSRRSNDIFSPISDLVAQSFSSIPQRIGKVVNQTIQRDLEELRKTVERENPELSSSINVVTQNNKIMYVMEGVGAADVEYGNEELAPRAYIRKAAQKTSRNLGAAVEKVVKQ